MSQQTATISVTNNMGSEAVIILYHQYTGQAVQAGGPWTVADGQTAGTLQAIFWTWDTGTDWWSISVGITSGPNAGSWTSYGSVVYPTQKECMMRGEDATNLTFSVSPQGFNINLKSGGCTATMINNGPYHPQINHVFVLMMENRSFDHMLGFSGITGTDAESGGQTSVEGPPENASNTYSGNGQVYPAGTGAPDVMAVDPGHEFADTLKQLGGTSAAYPSGGPYPPINNSGFVDDYASSNSPQEGNAPEADLEQIMQGYSPQQLPVLNALARQFAVCDHWFASMPGPTWPNRFFVYAATSGGLDDSPSSEDMAAWEAGIPSGVTFQHGTLFDAVGPFSEPGGCKLYHDDGNVLGAIPVAAALHNVNITDADSFADFASDLSSPYYNYRYTFIEPNYGDIATGTYSGGTSQHPMDNVHNGEQFIAQAYQAIRNSPLWNTSMLIITYDEHGGFYDHEAPGGCVAPGDAMATPLVDNVHGFNFEQLGIRVPAVIISPWVQGNVIDHRIYDHSSVPATVEALFGLPALTNRDANALNLTSLLSATTPRTDYPAALNVPLPPATTLAARALPDRSAEPVPERSNINGFLFAAMRAHMQLEPAEAHPAIVAEYNTIRTRGDAREYLRKVGARIKEHHAQKRVLKPQYKPL